ncbi:hypothetical protein [Desulfovirgula thermocuniculi]|uniref:hypothetical protein n=1 Tax=Desulfovirgula thermocuniculi TaxID=348842 RepID=UPI001B7F8B05|nr:hypothetical protein [Desulfovirgula thermocuniculi]
MSVILLLVAVSPALASWEGGGYTQGDPRDSRAPRSVDDVTMYVRQVPLLLVNPYSLRYQEVEGTQFADIYLDDVDVVWAEQWTKPGWADEETRFGLAALYVPVNPGMVPAPKGGHDWVLVPFSALKDENARELIEDWTVSGVMEQFRLYDPSKQVVWAADAVPAMWLEVPLPSRDALLAQGAGIGGALEQKWKPYFGDPVISADGSTTYYRVANVFQQGATYEYHLLIDPVDQNRNYEYAALSFPLRDEPTPTGKGFYRGREWAPMLENSNPGAVPGFIGKVEAWANLKLEGPAEVVGYPGEEKEAEFTVISECASDVATDLGTLREGEKRYMVALADLSVPARGRAPAKLKFKVEGQPYTVRVAVNPFKNVLETYYNDNYVDVVVKPLPPDFYIKIDPHQVKAQPGQELTFAVTAGLKPTFPQPWKALVRAFHVVNGVEYPASLTLNGVPVAPDQPVEFQPGEEKQGTVAVHAQNVGTTVVVKINPVDTSEDADWSDNRDEAQITTLVDVAVKVWPIKDPYVMSWYSSSLTPGVNVRVYRKDYGEPVSVKLTVDGPAGPKTFDFVLAGGESRTVQYYFTVTGGGAWTVSAEAWPVPGDLESYLPDNSASAQVTVIKREPPPTGSREPGIHGELGD